MSSDRGLLLSVGDAGEPAARALRVGWQDDADVPFRPGDEFPFEDCAVDVINVGEFAAGLTFATELHLLLECRRVLRPGGVIRIAPGRRRVPHETMTGGIDERACRDLGLVDLAAMAGLASTTTVPVAAAALPVGERHPPTIDFTKPERRVAGDPLVSIVIPAYNPRFFQACLDSALAQTYDNIEIVIGDDSPGPEIEALVRSRAKGHPVRYKRNAARLRPRANFVRCFERARGEFVKFLCDDDLLAPSCVATLLDAFRRAPDITLATSHRLRIDERGERLGEQPATVAIVPRTTVIQGHTLATAMLMAGLNTIGEPSTALFRKRDFLDRSPDYFHFGGTHGHGIIDMVMWSVLLLKGNAVYVHESLSSFRVHPGQRQHDPANLQRNIESIRSLQKAWLALQLHERQAADTLLVKPFPPGDADWHLQRMLGFAARRIVAPAAEAGGSTAALSTSL